MTRRFKPDGKPMRALRLLAVAQGPLYEDEVWRAAREAGDGALVTWHDALRTLVVNDLATVTGPRGGQRYAITEKGRRALA